ncbi:hypothetical protein B2A_05453, partial [mine drainage metagenome]
PRTETSNPEGTRLGGSSGLSRSVWWRSLRYGGTRLSVRPCAAPVGSCGRARDLRTRGDVPGEAPSCGRTGVGGSAGRHRSAPLACDRFEPQDTVSAGALGLSRESAWPLWMLEHLPLLKSEGWTVECPADFRHEMLSVDAWDIEIEDA